MPHMEIPFPLLSRVFETKLTVLDMRMLGENLIIRRMDKKEALTLKLHSAR